MQSAYLHPSQSAFTLTTQGLLALDFPRTALPTTLTDGRALGDAFFVRNAASGFLGHVLGWKPVTV
jgi:hypothetical protein